MRMRSGEKGEVSGKRRSKRRLNEYACVVKGAMTRLEFPHADRNLNLEAAERAPQFPK